MTLTLRCHYKLKSTFCTSTTRIVRILLRGLRGMCGS